jgi:hypothetical protein
LRWPACGKDLHLQGDAHAGRTKARGGGLS